jgi:hypothetical protein
MAAGCQELMSQESKAEVDGIYDFTVKAKEHGTPSNLCPTNFKKKKHRTYLSLEGEAKPHRKRHMDSGRLLDHLWKMQSVTVCVHECVHICVCELDIRHGKSISLLWLS